MKPDGLLHDFAWRILVLIMLGWIAVELHTINEWHGAPEPTQATEQEEVHKSLDDLRRRVVDLDAKFERLSENLARAQ